MPVVDHPGVYERERTARKTQLCSLKERGQRENLSCAACLQAVDSRKAHPAENKSGEHSEKQIEAC
jgi:hypothetical protein